MDLPTKLINAGVQQLGHMIESARKAKAGTLAEGNSNNNNNNNNCGCKSDVIATLAMGLAAVATVGLSFVILYLMFRKEGSSPALAAPSYVPVPMYLPPSSATNTVQAPDLSDITASPSVDDIPTVAPPPPPMSKTIGSTIVSTHVLPQLGTTQPAVRIATAYDIPTEAVLRCVGPPGSYVAFSFDPTELSLTNPVVPSGNTGIVPAGQFETIRMKPKSVLYAKGDLANTIISVSLAPFVTSVV